MSPHSLTIIGHGTIDGFMYQDQWITTDVIKDGYLDAKLRDVDRLYLCSCETGLGPIPEALESRYGMEVYSSKMQLRGGEEWKLERNGDVFLLHDGLSLPSDLVLSYNVSEVPGFAINGQFGGSLDMTRDGSVVVSGGYLDDPTPGGRGRVAVYNISNGGVFQKGTDIYGPNGSLLGYQVKISQDGNRVFASWQVNSNISVFDFIGSNWVLNETLFHPFSTTSIKSMAISDDGNLITATNGLAMPAIFYEYVGSSWVLGTRAIPSTQRHVAGNSDLSVIGVGNTSNNPARVYEWDGSAYIQNGLDFSFVFGSLDIFAYPSTDGDTVCIVDRSSASGRIRVFDWDGSTWTGRSTALSQADFQGNLNFPNVVFTADKTHLSIWASGINGRAIFNCETTPFSVTNYETVVQGAIGQSTNRSGLSDIVMSEDRSTCVVAYAPNNSGFCVLYDAALVPPPTPLIQAIDDVVSPTFYFNIDPIDGDLSAPTSVIDNDVYTPPQVAGTGTVTGAGLNAEAAVSASGLITVTTNHSVGDYSFTYTVKDDNNVDSNSANVTYSVIDFGSAIVPQDITQYVGVNMPINLSPFFTHLGMLDGDIVTSLDDNGIGSNLTGLVLTPNTTVAASQPYDVTLSFGGYTIHITGTLTILDPTATRVVDDLGTFDGVAGEVSTTSVVNNDTYAPDFATYWTVELTGVTPPIIVSLSATGFLTVPASTAPGSYTGTYVSRYTPTNTLVGGPPTSFTFEVTGPPIAVNDDLTPTPVDGIVGGTVGMIYVNDDDGNSPPLTGTLTSDGGLAGLTLGASSGVLTVPAGSSPGDYTATYTVMNNESLVSNTASILIRVFVTLPSNQPYPPNSLDITSYVFTPAGPIVHMVDPPSTVAEITASFLEEYTGPFSTQITSRLESEIPSLQRLGARIVSGQQVEAQLTIQGVTFGVSATPSTPPLP